MKRIVWFYGLAADGNSTTATLFYRLMRPYKELVILLDEEKLRTDFWPELPLTPEGQAENVKRMTRMARMYYDEGFTVIIAAFVPDQEQREYAQHLLPGAQFYLLNATDDKEHQVRELIDKINGTH